ncbi:hypothetical protein [Thermoactinomyces sp. DSM 45892]|uniref:hypothetical protein n=1 Tax=Thermoactinomyces sp. DSM 45892 TaxID=1882753 RepID=UPI00089CCFF6|nr:hypothetical protein [Thermoactinomyces sp. DSM 45892]SDY88287.1 hypothetical protein SAMN05444416_109161 [Thermoactinomyces sp. DSM 45892]
MPPDYSKCSQGMAELLRKMDKSKKYVQGVMNVKNGMFNKVRRQERRLIFEPSEVACCVCRKNVFKILDKEKRYCVRCLYEKYDFEEKVKMASLADFPVGIMILKNGRPIPFIWDEATDYADALEVHRMEKKCLAVIGIEGQFKFVLPNKIMSIKLYRDWGWDDEDMGDNEADQEVV